MSWQRTKHPGIYVRHREGCPRSETREARCRCKPAYRASRRHPVTRKKYLQRQLCGHQRGAHLATPAANDEAAALLREREAAGPDVRESWPISGGRACSTARSASAVASALTPTRPSAGYDRSLRHVPAAGVRPTTGRRDQRARVAAVRRPPARERPVALADRQPPRGRPRNLRAGPAGRPATWSPTNPTIGVELPPVDEVTRDRAATAEEAEALLEPARRRTIACPFALAFYAGLRRSEMDRLQWEDVDLERLWLVVRKSKSAAGTGRRLPIAAPLKPILLRGPHAPGTAPSAAGSSAGSRSPRAGSCRAREGLARRGRRCEASATRSSSSSRSACTNAATPTRAS